MDLTDNCRIFHLRVAKYTFSSAAPSQIDNILGHKAKLNKYQKIQIFSCTLYHKGMKLEINSKRNY
jgi:hypothetical protein